MADITPAQMQEIADRAADTLMRRMFDVRNPDGSHQGVATVQGALGDLLNARLTADQIAAAVHGKVFPVHNADGSLQGNTTLPTALGDLLNDRHPASPGN